MTRKPGDLPSTHIPVCVRHLPVTGIYWCGYRHGDDTQVLLLRAEILFCCFRLVRFCVPVQQLSSFGWLALGCCMKLRSIVVGISAGVGAGMVPSALAQEALQLASYTPEMGKEIVVTASRSAQQVQDTLASTTVITREQIDQSQARDLYQVLRTVPGVHLKRNGGRGNATSLSMRGGHSSGTLILVDGINVESATLGEVALEQIPLDQIDRIEVIRGPKSSLYGSSAMNGVIQIFTRKSAPKSGVTYSAGVGSDNTRDGVVSASGLSETSRYNATLSYVESDGFDSMYLDDTRSSSDRYNLDDDAYRRSAASFNGEQKFSDYLKANVAVSRAQGQADYDNRYLVDGLPHTEFETSLASTALTLDLDSFVSKLQYGLAKDSTENFNDMPDYTLFETRRNVGSWENSVIPLDWLTVNFGMDYTHEEVVGTMAYSQTRRDDFGGYANTRFDIDSWSWSLGMRHDDNEQFGSKWTGDTALGWEFTSGTTAIISYGQAYKAPSFNDLYWPFADYSFPPFYYYSESGNSNLVPEESETYEAGIDSYQDWGMASAHVYKTHVDNLIEWNGDENGHWEPTNLNSVTIRGTELQYGTEWIGIHWQTSFTYEKVTNNDTGAELDLRPRRRVALDVDRTLGLFAVGATLSGQSQQYDALDGERVVLGGYGQLDLRASWQVLPSLKLRTRIDNALDKDHEPAVGFNNESRFVMFFVDYTPQ